MRGCRSLSPAEIHKVLRVCSDARERALFLIGINLGLRVGELVGLRWNQVWDNGRILPFVYLERATTKNKRARSIPTNERVAGEIKKLRKASTAGEYLFPGRHAGHMSVRHANRVLGLLFQKAGLMGRLGSHCLRKTFSAILADSGVGIFIIQDLLGHASIATTRAYIPTSVKHMRDAVGRVGSAY